MFLLLIFCWYVASSCTVAISPNNCTVRENCKLHEYLTNIKYQNCRCDEKCSLYRDCCFNASKQKLYFEKTTMPSCKRIMSINWQSNIQIVDSCPQKFRGRKIMEQCQIDLRKLNPPRVFRRPQSQVKGTDKLMEQNDDLKDQLDDLNELFVYVPVSSIRTGVLFKNVYCALCNNVFKVDFWNMNISQRVPFPPGVNENATLLHDAFDAAERVRGGIRYHSTRFTARTCKLNVGSCHPSWQDGNIINKCNGTKSFASFVYHRTEATTYRNKFCAQCNFINETSLNCFDPRDDLVTSPPYRPFPFSILLDINRHSGARDSSMVGYVYQSVDELCPDGYIYNPITENCESLICDFALGSDSPEAMEIIEQCGYGNSSENASAAVQYELVWKFASAQGYITMILNTLSMCALIAQLVIYSLVPALMNTPGKCLMCLSASLLVAQFMFTFLIGQTGSHSGCVFIAVTIHFCFLAYFFWMNVMAFDVWRAFNHQNFLPKASQTSKRLLYYNLYAWLVPACIVVISIILDVSKSSLRPDYALNFCWFSSRRGLIVLFAVPLVIILIADIVFFTLTVVAIKKASESAKLATKKEQSRLSLYVKLASVMGLTWFSGFLAALTEVPPMWYIFIIFNSSQGIFIFVSFCCTKKVLRQLQDRLNKYKAKRKQSFPSTQQSELLVKRSGANSSPMVMDKHGLKDRASKV